jgi:hypothetical protein
MSRRTAWLVGMLALVLTAGAEAATPFANRSILRARADATRELRSVALPHGAEKVGGDPSLHRSLPPQSVACTERYAVELHGFWRVPGEPASAALWMRKHPPRHVRSVGFGSSSKYGKTLEWNVWLFFRDQSDVTNRMIAVTLRPARGGGTAIRVDAIAVAEPRPHQDPCVRF